MPETAAPIPWRFIALRLTTFLGPDPVRNAVAGLLPVLLNALRRPRPAPHPLD